MHHLWEKSFFMPQGKASERSIKVRQKNTIISKTLALKLNYISSI